MNVRLLPESPNPQGFTLYALFIVTYVSEREGENIRTIIVASAQQKRIF